LRADVCDFRVEQPTARINRVRADCAEHAAARAFVRPPIPCARGACARVGAIAKTYVTHTPDFACVQARAQTLAACEQTQFMIDECERLRLCRALAHR